MAELAGGFMERAGIEFQRERVPVKIEKIADTTPPKLLVTSVDTKGNTRQDVYNTVLFAIGRDACTKNIGLENVGVKLNPS
jgi:thioredoxin reductase (NADPH)